MPDAAAVRFCLELYATGVSHRIRRAGAPALRISATDSEFTVVAGEGHPAAAVRADEFELFRATSGRRGRAEVAGLQWEGDASPYLDCLNVFGPVPDDALSD